MKTFLFLAVMTLTGLAQANPCSIMWTAQNQTHIARFNKELTDKVKTELVKAFSKVGKNISQDQISFEVKAGEAGVFPNRIATEILISPIVVMADGQKFDFYIRISDATEGVVFQTVQKSEKVYDSIGNEAGIDCSTEAKAFDFRGMQNYFLLVDLEIRRSGTDFLIAEIFAPVPGSLSNRIKP